MIEIFISFSLGAFLGIVGFIFGFGKGYNKALKDNHILDGKDEDEFLRRMKEATDE